MVMVISSTTTCQDIIKALFDENADNRHSISICIYIYIGVYIYIYRL